ncbi:MAG: DNA mismatch repair endonuclease MutL [Spirochaetales bacterium]|nr:DNA mismatch repair endonuclease MutL [Spirochaetales bacterium]
MASIRQLDPIVASRIAAGEVVERPSSVLRELLDNSIDAKATKISIYIEEGGIKSLTVIDNGVGMDADDLLLACNSHATSKVRSLDDLFNLKTLGFRGEALSSIAACSKLTISSNGNSITVDNGNRSSVVPGSIMQGTSVCMEDLFANIPARRLFLKRPQSEAAECRKTLLEKALGFEDVEFLFFSDGELKLHFERTDRKNRSLQVFSLDKSFVPAQILQMSYKGENESLWAVCSDPSCHRRDRTQIRILVNNRIIDSYQFVQAITNAYSAALPGGAFPYFHLFIDANPALVDFNIHPTKRECKLRNQSAIYGAITTMIRNALVYKQADTTEVPQLFSEARETPARPYTAAPASTGSAKPTISQNSAKPFDSSWFESAKAILSKKDDAPRQKAESPAKAPAESAERAPSVVTTTKIIPQYRYIGQVFNTFLVVEQEDTLLFIDQHALHERLLYDEIRSLRDVQRLIVPYSFEV